MHGLNRIKAANEKAANDQLASKSKRPASFDRNKVNGAAFPRADRSKTAPHGDPLTRPTAKENAVAPNEDYDRGFTEGYSAAIDYLERQGI